jgi:hypothetical protein
LSHVHRPFNGGWQFKTKFSCPNVLGATSSLRKLGCVIRGNRVSTFSRKAKRQSIDLFRRFAVMRYWREVRHVAFARLLAPDGLHMNDWSYGCMANLLASAIADASSTRAQPAFLPVPIGNVVRLADDRESGDVVA